MAKNVNNKYPADKTGTKYSEFRNTKRIPASKAGTERDTRQSGGGNDQAATRKT